MSKLWDGGDGEKENSHDYGKRKNEKKLKDAAKEGDAKALMKVKSIKKADRVKAAKYWKVKQNLRDKIKSDDAKG